jgi:hypothetical protein
VYASGPKGYVDYPVYAEWTAGAIR